jgi:TolB-like protein
VAAKRWRLPLKPKRFTGCLLVAAFLLGFCKPVVAATAASTGIDALAVQLLENYLRGRPNAPRDLPIAVLPFDAPEDLRAKNFGHASAAIVLPRFVDSNSFRPVERSELQKILAEQNLQQTGAFDSKTAVRLGGLLGVKALVLGRIDRVGSEYNISARIVDVRSGEILATSFQSIAAGYFEKAAASTPIVRPHLTEGRWGLLTRVDYSVMGNKRHPRFSFALRSPSRKWEGEVFVGAYHQAHTTGAQFTPGQPIFTQETVARQTTYVGTRVTFGKRLSYLDIPGVMLMPFPGSVGMGIGLNMYRVSEHRRRNETRAATPTYRVVQVDNTIRWKPAPSISAHLARDISNAFEARLKVDYVISPRSEYSELDFGGLWLWLGLGYRIL